MNIEIEKGVPAPLSSGRGAPKYPFRVMEVGDSFVVARVKNNLSHAAAQYARNHRAEGIKFVTRAVTGGVRCWRIT